MIDHIATLRKILSGIDELQTDSRDGWWETSTGANFGAGKLKEVEILLEQVANNTCTHNELRLRFEELRLRFEVLQYAGKMSVSGKQLNLGQATKTADHIWNWLTTDRRDNTNDETEESDDGAENDETTTVVEQTAGQPNLLAPGA